MLKILISLFLVFSVFDNPIAHLHKPFRLRLLDPNKTITGVVKHIEESIDGSSLIRLSVKDKTLLVKNNYTKEDSCLVLEIVCDCESFFNNCDGYVNKISKPYIGDTITVRGLFVFNKQRKINEINPVLEIKKILN